mmetsp:Transcript_82686/g.221004  ORF Transcript_82686/g.221004 Transcript_82686/m.221004 type:complete len:367 (-) Transcript_82686:134-1234(-)
MRRPPTSRDGVAVDLILPFSGKEERAFRSRAPWVREDKGERPVDSFRGRRYGAKPKSELTFHAPHIMPFDEPYTSRAVAKAPWKRDRPQRSIRYDPEPAPQGRDKREDLTAADARKLLQDPQMWGGAGTLLNGFLEDVWKMKLQLDATHRVHQLNAGRFKDLLQAERMERTEKMRVVLTDCTRLCEAEAATVLDKAVAQYTTMQNRIPRASKMNMQGAIRFARHLLASAVDQYNELVKKSGMTHGWGPMELSVQEVQGAFEMLAEEMRGRQDAQLQPLPDSTPAVVFPTPSSSKPRPVSQLSTTAAGTTAFSTPVPPPRPRSVMANPRPARSAQSPEGSGMVLGSLRAQLVVRDRREEACTRSRQW